METLYAPGMTSGPPGPSLKGSSLSGFGGGGKVGVAPQALRQRVEIGRVVEPELIGDRLGLLEGDGRAQGLNATQPRLAD